VGAGFDPAGADKQQMFSENYFTELKKCLHKAGEDPAPPSFQK
jgi:hypothetical protein